MSLLSFDEFVASELVVLPDVLEVSFSVDVTSHNAESDNPVVAGLVYADACYIAMCRDGRYLLEIESQSWLTADKSLCLDALFDFYLAECASGLKVVVSDSATPGYMVVTDASLQRVPDDFDTDVMVFQFFPHGRLDAARTITLQGRSGLNAWYVDNVGYSLEECDDKPVALVSGVCEMMFFHAYGLD